MTTSLGSLFQCMTTLSVKNLFLISSLNLPCHSLTPFPQVLSLVTKENRSAPAPPLPLVRKLYIAMRSPLSLLFFQAEQAK